MEQYLPVILNVVGILLGLALTYGVGYLITRFKFSDVEAEATKGLKGAVMSIFHAYVKPTKAENKAKDLGRKLTPEQANKARQLCKDVAYNQLKGKAKEFFLTMADGRKDEIIEWAVNLFKKNAKEVKK